MRKVRWSRRVCGFAALLGGFALISGDVGTSIIHAGVNKSQAAVSAAWVPLTSLFLVGFCGACLALVGLQLGESPGSSPTLALTFCWALAGTMMFFGMCWSGAFVLPAAAARVPAFVDSADHPGVMAVGYGLSTLLFVSGWVAYSVAARRSGIVSTRLTWLLIGGAVLSLASVFEVPFPFAVFGLALLALGRTLFAESPTAS